MTRRPDRNLVRSLALSEALGGAGADNLTSCIVAEELAVGDIGIAVTLAETSRLYLKPVVCATR